MNVTFLHPRESRTFPADVDPETTGQTCLTNLVSERFLEPPPSGRPYYLVLQRTQRQILPAMTMREAEVQDRDAFAVLQQDQGARSGTQAR